MQFIDLKTQQSKIRENIEARIKTVLNHGQYIMGPEVLELEEVLANDIGVKHCVSCSSGTDALLILLMARGVGPGDAVITTPFTYIATAEVISLLGATPVFVDIYEKTYNVDASKIEKAIKESKKKGLTPKVIIPVDLFGLPARYRIIKKVAIQYNLFIIEDAAQGYGGKIRNEKACSFGDAATTSFFPAKPLGCYGDGGAIFTNYDDLSEIIKSIRNHGAGSDKYNNIRVGINGRLDSIQAGVLLDKFKIFNNEMESRQQIANRYSKGISEKFIKPFIPTNYKTSWAQYCILIPDDIKRSDVIEKLRINNIPTMVYYPIPLHLQTVYKALEYEKGDFPISEKISERILALPMHPYLKRKKQNTIIEGLNNICN